MMDRGFVIACPARSLWLGFILKQVQRRVWINFQQRRATGSNNNVGKDQKRKGTALSLAPQAGGGRDRRFALRDRVLCCLRRQWPDGLSAKEAGISRARSPDQGAATTKRRNGTRN